MFDVITFGSATRDLFVQSKNFKSIQNKKFITGKGICLDSGSKMHLDELVFATGGGGTNTAATFAEQGLETAYVGKVGNDPGGAVIKQELSQIGIKGFISTDQKRRTSYSIILSMPRKGRSILVYRGACYFLDKSEIPFDKLKTKWIYIAGLSGEYSKLLFPIIDLAKKNNLKIALNPGSTQLDLRLKGLKRVLSEIDVLLLNQEEAARLSGLSYKQEKQIFKKLDKHVPGIAVMTKGPKGALVSDGNTLYTAGIFKEKKHTDRTGAGDAFGAGFVAGLIKTGKIEQAIRLGTANACSVVEHFGAKNGILSNNQFKTDKRWKNLKIIKQKL